MPAHAVLSPSSSSRWLACPGGLLPSLEIPSTTSPYAEEGTVAHEWFEKYLNGVDIKALMLDDIDMFYHVRDGGDYVLKTTNGLVPVTESKMFIFKVKNTDCFGTVDAYAIVGKTLHVFDFKYGAGVRVEAKLNTQMMLYAYGVLQKMRDAATITSVEIHIVQPRMNNYSMYGFAIKELEQFIEEYVKPTAMLAVTGRGAVVAGDHCRFCPLKGRCAATSLINELEHNYKAEQTYSELRVDQKILAAKNRLDVKRWLDNVNDSLIEDISSGRITDARVEVIEKTRPIRIADEAKALQILTDAGVTNVSKLSLLPYGQLKAHAELLKDVIEVPTTKTLVFVSEEE